MTYYRGAGLSAFGRYRGLGAGDVYSAQWWNDQAAAAGALSKGAIEGLTGMTFATTWATDGSGAIIKDWLRDVRDRAPGFAGSGLLASGSWRDVFGSSAEYDAAVHAAAAARDPNWPPWSAFVSPVGYVAPGATAPWQPELSPTYTPPPEPAPEPLPTEGVSVSLTPVDKSDPAVTACAIMGAPWIAVMAYGESLCFNPTTGAYRRPDGEPFDPAGAAPGVSPTTPTITESGTGTKVKGTSYTVPGGGGGGGDAATQVAPAAAGGLFLLAALAAAGYVLGRSR